MTTTTRVRVLYGLLGLASAFVLVFNVVPAVMSYDTTGVLASMPFVGPQQVPSVAVVEGAGFRERWEQSAPDPDGPGQRQMFPWTDGANGTVDAATGLPPVELWTSGGLRLAFWGQDSLGRLAFALSPLGYAALAFAVIWQLWRVVRTLSGGEVFTPRNARRVTVIGLLIAFGPTALQLAQLGLERLLVARSAAAGIVDVPFSLNLTPLWVGAVVALLAEVFRQGVRLRTEVDGLV